MSESESPKRGDKKTEQHDPQATAETGQTDSGADAAPSQPPRNPWQSEPADPGLRRSAGLEQILRQRGQTRSASGLPKGWLGWALLGSLSAWLLSTSIHVLAQGESGVLTTLGRYEGKLEPGLNITMPWPFQSVTRSNLGGEMTTLLPDNDTETLMPTRDGELIDLRVQVRWRVSDLRAFSQTFPDGEAAIRRLTDSAIRAAAAEVGFDDLRGGKNRAQFQQRVADRLQRVLSAWKSGVSVVAVEVTGANPPARLADTFKAVNDANEAAAKNRETAQAYAKQVTLGAQAEAAAFDRAYALYRIAPDVTRQQIYYSTVEGVLRNNPVVIGNGPAASATAAPPPESKPAAEGR